MITRRTWTSLAATVIAFALCLGYRNDRPAAYQPMVDVAVAWHLSEDEPNPYEEWLAIGEICAGLAGISLLLDFIIKRHREK